MPISLLIHIVLMSLTGLLITIASIIAFRRRKKWYSFHRLFTISGTVSGISGILFLIIVKQIAQEPHFQPLHSKIGLITGIFMLILLIIGLSFSRLPHIARKVHRYTGRITAVALLITIGIGVYLII